MNVSEDRIGRKDRARTLAERRTRSHQTPVAHAPGPVPDLTCCDRCGLVFFRKTWRRARPGTARALLGGRRWGVCPACRQAESGQAFGRVLLGGDLTAALRRELERRIRNVCRRAAFTQPERRLLALRPQGGGLEVLTTSQKLAHRIAREMEKAFGGIASYAWSDGDGRLLARWRPEGAGVTGPRRARRRHRGA
jgi:hypothetical protein